MCQFFSAVTNGDGKLLYFDAKMRKKILAGKTKYEQDSHTSIATHFGFIAEKEDKLNKYEYNPLTKKFTIDQINNKKDDSKKAEENCNKLDFKNIVPLLIIKPIINPFTDFHVTKAEDSDIVLLKEWASVWASVGASVRASVWASVRASVGASVWASVWDSVWDSVGASVRASVWDSVWASVWASVGAYIGTFVDTKYKVNIKPAQELWMKGIVPSYDGTLWRLHGHEGKIIYTISQEDLKKWEKP